MKTHYLSLKSKTEYLWKEKGSKFIGIAQKCCDEDEVKSALGQIKMEHANATHICYAYKIGVNAMRYRANDDGEPSNSAGTPILGQINSFELENVLIAVVRYYGGTKLGVGGLISAYRNAAKFAIEENEIIEEELSTYFNLKVDYQNYALAMNVLKEFDLNILNQIDDNGILLDFHCRNSRVEELKFRLESLNNCTILIEKTEE